MPSAPALVSHASMSGVSLHESREVIYDVARRTQSQRDPAVCPTDDEAAVPKRKEAGNKRSLEYVWRSGVAGGMAGSVVCLLDTHGAEHRVDKTDLGKNHGCAT